MITLTLPTPVFSNPLQKTFNVEPFDLPVFNQLKTINDIEQDRHGFIWLASSTGLYRFDGSDLKQYHQQLESKNSLPHFHINDILLDRNSNMWVGTGFGLAIYREDSDDFERFFLTASRANLVITTLVEDKYNNIWVGTRGHGVFKINDKREVIAQFLSRSNEKHQLTDDYVKCLFEDKEGRMWIGTSNGLNRYDPIADKMTQHTIAGAYPDKTENQYILDISGSPNLPVLIATIRGLFSYNPNSDNFSAYNPNGLRLPDLNILSINISPDNELLIGTNNGGLSIFSPIKQSTLTFQKNASKASKLASNTVWTTFTDNEGDIWIGTGAGLNKINYASDFIELYRKENNTKHCLSGNASYVVYLSTNKVLWVGIEGQGLHRIDLKTSKCDFVGVSNTNLNDASLSFVLDLQEDSKGNIWIATYKEGLVKLDPETMLLSRIKLEDTKQTNILKTAYIYKLLIDNDDNIWLAMGRYGLGKFDITGEFLELIGESIAEKLNARKISVKTIEQSDNQLWLGTQFHGLISFDKNTHDIKKFMRPSKDEKGVPENITASSLDKKGGLWLGSRGYGLYRFDINTHEIDNFRVIHGLSNNVIWNIEADNNGNIWSGTNYGVSVFDTNQHSFTNYFENDGIQNNEATTSGFYDSASDQIWTGGMNGINRINVQKRNDKTRKLKTAITGVKVNYEGLSIADNSPLKTNILNASEILLNHQQNNFSFNFSAIEFREADKVKYQYQLEGYDRWNTVDQSKRYANYTNIDPGEYVFKVRASLNDDWQSPDTSIKITVTPPWWKTKLAYSLYILAIIASVFALIHFRTRSIQQKSIKLENSVKERTKELAQEKHKVEQLLSRKNEEFANVSHEFRTPLTLILGPLAQVLKTNKSAEEINRLNMVQRNGYRLLRMVDQLLNMETFRVQSITQKSSQAIGKTIRLITEAFADLAQDKNIELTLKKTINVNFEFTPDAFEKILLNLLSNAIKYTPQYGSITVTAQSDPDNHLKIEVADTGIGIPSDKRDAVFERYNRVLDQNSEQVTGAGIGLALVKELVEAHEGRIELESELGAGTKVTVYLPIINEVDDGQVSNHSNNELVAMELMSITSQATALSTTEGPATHQEHAPQTSVLIIEDNPDMQDYIVSAIADDYQVLTANNGEEGFKIALQEVPDLIISDIMMPIMDGYETTQALRKSEITNHIPIILLTARGDRESRLKGWYHQVDEYLTKPFDVEELRIRLSNLLEIRNILRKRFGEAVFQENVGSKPNDKEDVDSYKANLQQEFIEHLNQVLSDIYSKSTLSVAEIASAIAMSERQIFRKIKNLLDITPAEYLRRYRLEKAKQILKAGKSISYTAVEVGFSSQSYFGKCFKAQYGISPKEFRNSPV